ncbi:MAG: TRAP transporter large permease subunit, partial [Planctomycetota bacterium]|nr:TRAP transporter large permease subunit [Planctomycetota bacterium]
SEQIPQRLSFLFINNISSRWAALVVINMFLLVVGTFMDTTAAIIILVPVLMPVIKSFGIDPVHFGLIMILNLMIGLLTPPVGLVLYVLSGISNVPFERIAYAVLPYVFSLIVLLVFLTFVPEVCLFLPDMLFG